MMSVIEKLASSLGRKDEVPNQELAKQLVDLSDKNSITELVDNLSNKNKSIQSDCVKTLYEIGMLNPKFISNYAADFVKLLESKNNRLQWGAMMALNTITTENPKIVYAALGKLALVVDKGSVITRDNYVAILTKLSSVKEYSEDAFSLIIEQLKSCPSNQLPMYAENALPIITVDNKELFANTLIARLNDFEKESKRKRVEKVLKKIPSIK